MDVSENSGTPKSSILIEFSIINHLFWGTPIFGNTHIAVEAWKHMDTLDKSSRVIEELHKFVLILFSRLRFFHSFVYILPHLTPVNQTLTIQYQGQGARQTSCWPLVTVRKRSENDWKKRIEMVGDIVKK